MSSIFDCSTSIGGYVSSGATAPTSPSTNDLWFNTTTKAWSLYDGTRWTAIPTGGGGGGFPPPTAEGEIITANAALAWVASPAIIEGNF